MVLNDEEILRRIVIEHGFPDMPLSGSAPGLLSFGLDSAAYDFRLDYTIRVLRRECGVLDPKQPMDEQFEVLTYKPGQRFYLPPLGFALGLAMERVWIPDDCIALVCSKSTMARVAISQPLTKWEPEWNGKATLELFNCAPVPVVMYPGEGICSVIFLELTGRPKRTYKDKNGKYQGDLKIVQAR